jgi:hypothetical protein
MDPRRIFDYELVRLKSLHDAANANLRKAVKTSNQTQIDIAKERTQFFEKLAIGSGATIAAIVSFLGAHSQRLQPPWILRASLVALVVTLFSALFRNLRYPKYVLSATEIGYWEASIEEQERRREMIGAEQGRVADIYTGLPFDTKKTARELGKSTEEALKIMSQKRSREKRHLREWQTAEKVCLTAVCVAMVSLVWLALVNF